MTQIVVTRPSRQDLAELGVPSWSSEEYDISCVSRHYDQKEMCFLLSGQATVRAGTQTIVLHEGDLAVFPAGTDCTWDVRQPIHKRYRCG